MKKMLSAAYLCIFTPLYASTNGQGLINFSGDSVTHHLYDQDGSTWNANNNTALTQAINSTKGQYAVFANHSPPLLTDTANLFIIDAPSNGTDAILKHFFKKAGAHYYVYDSDLVTSTNNTTITNNNLTNSRGTWQNTGTYGFSLSSNVLTITDSAQSPLTLAVTYTAGTIPSLDINGQGFITFSGESTTHHLYNQDGSTWNAVNTTDHLIQAINSTKGQYAVFSAHYPPLLTETANLFLVDNISSGTDAILKRFFKNTNQNYYVYDATFQASSNNTIILSNNLTNLQSTWTGSSTFSFGLGSNALTLFDDSSNSLVASYSTGTIPNISAILGWREPDIAYTIDGYGIHTSYTETAGQALLNAFQLENQSNYVIFGDLGLGIGSSFYPQVARTLSVTPSDLHSNSSNPSYNFIGDPGSTHSVSYTTNSNTSSTASITDTTSDFSVVTSDCTEELYNNILPLKSIQSIKSAPNNDNLASVSSLSLNSLTFPLPALYSPSNYPSSSSRALPGFGPIATSPYSMGRSVSGCTIPVLIENISKYYIYTCSNANYISNNSITFRFQITDSSLKNILKRGVLTVTL